MKRPRSLCNTRKSPSHIVLFLTISVFLFELEPIEFLFSFSCGPTPARSFGASDRTIHDQLLHRQGNFIVPSLRPTVVGTRVHFGYRWNTNDVRFGSDFSTLSAGIYWNWAVGYNILAPIAVVIRWKYLAGRLSLLNHPQHDTE